MSNRNIVNLNLQTGTVANKKTDIEAQIQADFTASHQGLNDEERKFFDLKGNLVLTLGQETDCSIPTGTTAWYYHSTFQC